MGFLNSVNIGPKIIGGYVSAGLAMAILAYMLLSSISGVSNKFNFLVHHDTPVLTNAQQLTRLMVDMETGLRGYLVTGQTGYLDPYNNGRSEFERVMAAEQELTSDNPAAVAMLRAIHALEQEWLTGYAEGAIELREEVEQGAAAQENFAAISARTIGKEQFDAIRALLGGITAKFEAADDLEGRFIMQAITLDLVNMETGQRGFLLTGEDASLDPFNDGQARLTSDVKKLRAHDYAAAGVSASEIDGIQVAVTGWKEAAAQPEIDARIEVRSFPKDMGDVIALVDSGVGKQSMDVIRADLGGFLESELALNVIRAEEVEAQASSARTKGIGIAVASITIMMGIGFFLSRSIVIPINKLVSAAEALAKSDLGRRVEITANNELGALGRAFNSMAERILMTIDDLAFQNGKLQNEVASRQIVETELETQRRELALSNRALESHYTISQIFGGIGDFNSKANSALEKLIILTGADWATFRLTNGTDPGLYLAAAAGPAVMEFPPKPVVTDTQSNGNPVSSESRTIVTDDNTDWPAASQLLVDMGMQSLVSLPVKVNERALGLVTVVSQKKSHFSSEIMDLLTFVVDRLGVLVENSMLLDESERANQELQESAEALSRSNQELEQFANIASHDLQEPLRMVSSYTQLLESRYKDQLDADAQVFIGYAVDGARRMQTKIRDLLAFSRLTTQGMPFDSTDCSGVLDQATANLSVSIRESEAVITSDPLPTVNGDNSQLVSVFQNLIGNGIKYIGDQRPRIHVSAVERGEDWLFSIRDNGIGIKAEYSDRIFLIFQRLYTKDEYDGTGIGLAICKKVIERHGGRIWVESEPDNGSTFYFTLPRAIIPDN